MLKARNVTAHLARRIRHSDEKRSEVMWFGVAPSPAPSPSRTNTQAWHPPHCTCARHRKTIAQSQEQQLHGYNANSPSPRAHMLSPRKQLLDAKSNVLPLTGRDDKNMQQAVLVPVPVSVGPISPRAHRRQREQPTQMARKLPEASRLDSFFAHAGVVASSKRDNSALWDSLDAITLARPSIKAGRDVAEEPAVALVDEKQPEEDDSHVIHSSSGNNDFSHTPGNDDCDDNNNSVTSTALPENVVVERKASRSGRRASRGADRVWNTERPQTGQADSNVYSQAPPKSRRSSRIYSALSSDNSSDQKSSSEYVSTFFPSQVQPENLVGHASSVCSVVASDDRYIISCSVDGSVKVWSRASFNCLHTLFGHDDNVSCIDINARWLVSGSHDTTLRVYSCLESFKLLHILRGHTAHVTKVYLPPGCPQQILSCSDDSTIRIWNGELGYCTFVLRDHSSRVTCFYTEGRRVCSGAADAAVCFWDLPTTADKLKSRELRATEAFRVHKSTVQVLAAKSSVDSTLVLSGSNDGAIQIFNFQTLEYIGCLDVVHSPIYSMRLLSNSQLVCSTGDGRLLHFSDFYSHPLVKSELRLADRWISMLQPRGNTVVCSSEDMLYVVDAEQLRVLTVIETMHGFVNSVGWLHATALISGGQDNVVKIWNIGCH